MPAPVGTHTEPPTVTVAINEKLDPNNVSTVPPVVGPVVGLIDEIDGALYEKD